MSFEHLKVGDRVDRYHGNGFFMELEVVGFGDNLLVCAAVQPDGGLFMGGWTFDMATGAEVDNDLEWGPKWGRTGTYLKLKNNPSADHVVEPIAKTFKRIVEDEIRAINKKAKEKP